MTRSMYRQLDDATPEHYRGVLQRVGISGPPVFSVENACASSGAAVHLAWQAIAAGVYDCVLVAGRYTLLDQTAIPLIQECAARGIAYLAAGVFNSGILARPADGAWYDYAPAARATLDRALQIERVCQRHGVTLRASALSFVLAHPGVTVVIVGMAAPEEVDENVEAARAAVPDDLWTELDEQGLVVTTRNEEGPR